MKPTYHTYLYTDMASELFRAAKTQDALHPTGNPLHDSGFDYSETFHGRIRTEKLVIASEEASSILGKTRGTYYTVHTGDLRFLDDEDYTSCKAAVRAAVLDAAAQLCPDFEIPCDTRKAIHVTAADTAFDSNTVLQTSIDDPGITAWDRLAVSPEWDLGGHLHNAPIAAEANRTEQTALHADGEPFVSAGEDRSAVTDIPPTPIPEHPSRHPMTVLVVGLGNPALTTDALGPMCVSHLCVTRHMVDGTSSAPLDGHIHRLCAVTPLVLGKTGIETLDLVRGAVQAVEPHLVILIDALAASELGSLAQTVQVATTGIHPGGGVGNKRLCLDKDTLGVPVMTIGVPTVIAASTLIYRALEGAGILPQDDTAVDDHTHRILHHALATADIGYVAPKDIDESITAFAHLIAHTVNTLALGDALSASLRYGI